MGFFFISQSQIDFSFLQRNIELNALTIENDTFSTTKTIRISLANITSYDYKTTKVFYLNNLHKCCFAVFNGSFDLTLVFFVYVQLSQGCKQ